MTRFVCLSAFLLSLLPLYAHAGPDPSDRDGRFVYEIVRPALESYFRNGSDPLDLVPTLFSSTGRAFDLTSTLLVKAYLDPSRRTPVRRLVMHGWYYVRHVAPRLHENRLSNWLRCWRLSRNLRSITRTFDGIDAALDQARD